MKKLISLFVLIICFSNTSYSINLDSGLVAYYPFNGSTIDESGNGNDLSNYGASYSVNRFNVPNRAVLFTPGSYMEKDSPLNFPFGGSPKTISCWVNSTTSFTTMVIVEWGSHFYSQRFAMMTYVLTSTEFFSGFANDVLGNVVIPDNHWKHIVITYEIGNLRMYVNGLTDINGTIPVLNTSGSKLRIAKSVIETEGYSGLLDDIRIYNRALSESEVQELYTESETKSICIKAIPQGFYSPLYNRMSMKDSVSLILRNANSPYNVIDSSKAIIDSVTFKANFISNVSEGSYYLIIKHRNCTETWSSMPVQINSDSVTYDFTLFQSNSYGNNSILIDTSPVRFGIFSGDVNQDGTIDASDLSDVDNDAYSSLSGYVNTDVTGDNFVDAADVSIVDNNALSSVSIISP